MGYETIEIRREGPVAKVVLNRAEALNALNLKMVVELGGALAECAAPDVRVVVLTGTGRAFCAGGDVKSFVDSLSEDPVGYLRDLADEFHQRVVLGIRRLAKPVIGSINGVAAGGGLSLALCCDLRIAADNARLATAYSNIGLSADGGSTFFLPRLVGLGRSAEIFMFAEVLDANKAFELGIVNKVVPAAELESATDDWAIRLAAGPTRAHGVVKKLLNRTFANDLTTQLDTETAGMAELAMTQDYREGVTAFAEKRQPNFRGG
ncbi:MAG: enoyl-CoA hydratase/isomerase family protein [Chloroflexi bacterium]|nr:enoyl-CoA hydratase/isomerase family protein [Chloroflexota bacterium]